jgi:hypothetical protein
MLLAALALASLRASPMLLAALNFAFLRVLLSTLLLGVAALFLRKNTARSARKAISSVP